MGIDYNNVISTDGLFFYLDAANTRCYSGSGITANNLISGVGATLVNGVGFSSFNSGFFTFDGTNDYVSIPYPSQLRTGSAITVSFWAKWTTTGTTTATIQTLLDNNYQTAYLGGPGTIGFVIQDRPDLGKVLELGDGTWRHITGTNNGSTSILYIDGIQSGLARTAAGIGDSQPLINIGRWAFSNNRYLNGNVSGLLIYNRALSDSEVYQNYVATKRRYGL
jgi:hypothetical protein